MDGTHAPALAGGFLLMETSGKLFLFSFLQMRKLKFKEIKRWLNLNVNKDLHNSCCFNLKLPTLKNHMLLAWVTGCNSSRMGLEKEQILQGVEMLSFFCGSWIDEFRAQKPDLDGKYLGALGSIWASLVAQMVKNLPAVQETWVWFLGWKDPLEKGNSNPLQYSCLENPMDRGAWQAIVHGVTKSWT